MIVLKFGGSSVGNAERIDGVISILIDSYINKKKKIAVVFSAFQGVTDKFIEIGKLAFQRKLSYKAEIEQLIERHYDTAFRLNPTSMHEQIVENLDRLFDDLKEVTHGVYLVRELSPRTLDYIQSFGERLSNTIIAESLCNRGVEAEYLDASSLVKTNSEFGNAKVNFPVTNKNIAQHFKKHNKVQIITGFISSTEKNEITTLGRGGSDYTASIFGAALNAGAIEIWTDVDGILTADPRKVKEAFSLKSVTYEEAMELSHFGAKVIYPPTMLPALQKKIKIVIKNTFNPSHPGTEIIEKSSSEKMLIKGISSIDDISIIRVQGGGMVGVTGVAGRLFTVLARHGINIILITQASSEHSICLAVLPKFGEHAKKIIESEFKLEIIEGKIGEVVVEDELSIIAVVGEKMRHTIGVAGKVFNALGKKGINIIAIAQGSSELNISLVINKNNLTKALLSIHKDLLARLK
ncbi:MAG: bifunctional aspartokinase I/homoserine dehydrogenase I [Ignavibacteria bacterium]|nr:MAG: bifunctional aspartokinase I/homoserine dehydrogenase I [Ignavibacteria bacterium]KAF0158882.1 MAG: bifunctional aspartokinase I/homoserine dehydrogenase I [Ignavibacteria bacterium]